jgi:hypothetical protein
MALILQFQWGLREDFKDLLLTLLDATTLLEAITQAVLCDNHLFYANKKEEAGLSGHWTSVGRRCGCVGCLRLPMDIRWMACRPLEPADDHCRRAVVQMHPDDVFR